MMLIRPVTLDDLDPLLNLSKQAAFGLTTLPKDRAYLEKRINQSVDGFSKLSNEPAGEAYLFVLENTQTREIVGTTGVVSKVGGFEPFYAFNLETSHHESKQLKISKDIHTLHLVKEHDGPCEIGSLFLSPNGRGKGLGRLLSLSRFLFMAEFPTYFDDQVIAELRGVIDENGHSPFWDAVGKHFFEVDFPTADYLSILNKRFIAELLPEHPIYIPLLPIEAQKVIGQVHPNTEPALKLLQGEGFRKNGQVDIFEAGPTVIANRDEIRSVKQSRRAKVSKIVAEIPDESQYIISNTNRHFHATLSPMTIEGDSVMLTTETAACLNVGVGDNIRYVSPRPEMST